MSIKRVIKFESFISLAIWLWSICGVPIHTTVDGAAQFSRRRKIIYRLRQCAHLGILSSILIAEYGYVVANISHPPNVPEFMLSVSFALFGHLGVLRVSAIYRNHSSISQLLIELRELYPVDEKQQTDFNLTHYYGIYWWRCKPFVYICLVLVVVHNAMPMVFYYIFTYWLGLMELEHKIPYYLWLPWSTESAGWYFVLYFMGASAGSTTMLSTVGCDSLLYGIVSQIIMQYNYLAKRIESYAVKGNKKDMDFFKYITKYHQRLLALSDETNRVFHNCLLLNFAVSLIIICCSGFMLLLNESEKNLLVAVFVFVGCSLVEVYTISKFSEELLEASTGIGNAAFNQNWYHGDRQYRKMLSLCILRAQRPAVLKTTFFVIQMETFSALMQMSYKFMAILRTMFAE